MLFLTYLIQVLKVYRIIKVIIIFFNVINLPINRFKIYIIISYYVFFFYFILSFLTYSIY